MFAHHRDALSAVTKRRKAGDVIGMEVGVNGLDQSQVELCEQLDIAVDSFQHWIDDEGLAAMPTSK
jgi:hypothetical protein